MKEKNKHQNLKMENCTLENQKKTNAKKPMDKRKCKLNKSSRSSLLKEMKCSICSDIRDMVKLRNEKSRPVLKEESEEELFGRTLAFELKQLPQYEKVMAKHEPRSVMFKYQMMAVQNNMGN